MKKFFDILQPMGSFTRLHRPGFGHRQGRPLGDLRRGFPVLHAERLHLKELGIGLPHELNFFGRTIMSVHPRLAAF
jgi:hypothetical protein